MASHKNTTNTNEEETNTSRREFLTTAGKVAGAATLSVSGITAASISTEASAESKPDLGTTQQTIPEGFQVVTIGISGPPMDMPNKNRTWPATLVQFQDKYFLVNLWWSLVILLTPTT